MSAKTGRKWLWPAEADAGEAAGLPTVTALDLRGRTDLAGTGVNGGQIAHPPTGHIGRRLVEVGAIGYDDHRDPRRTYESDADGECSRTV